MTAEWQPIETYVPDNEQDDKDVLVFDYEEGVLTGKYSLGLWYASYGNVVIDTGHEMVCLVNLSPTHWMPLPKAPDA